MTLFIHLDDFCPECKPTCPTFIPLQKKVEVYEKLNDYKVMLINARGTHMQDQTSLINTNGELDKAKEDLKAALKEVDSLKCQLQLAQHDVITKDQELDSKKRELEPKQHMLDTYDLGNYAGKWRQSPQ